MRSLIKLSLASLAAVALFAGMAFAQDKPTLAVNLDLIGSLGQQTNTSEVKAKPSGKVTDTAASGFNSQWQADLNVNAALGDAGGRFKLRFRDTGANVPDTDRSELWYNFGAVQLKMHIRSWGLPVSTIAYSAYTGTTTTGGWPTDVAGPVAFWVNQSGLDVSFNAPTVHGGVAIFDACVPTCGYSPNGLSSMATQTGVFTAGSSRVTGGGTAAAFTDKAQTGGNSTGTKNTQSFVPYFYGDFGPATVGVFLASTSGVVPGTKTTGLKTKDDDKPVTGSLTDVNGKITFGPAIIALEYASWSASCDKKRASTSGGTGGFAVNNVTVTKCGNQTDTLTVLGGRIQAGPGRVEFHVATFAEANSVSTASTKSDWSNAYTDTMLGYAIPLNASYWLVPVYESRATAQEVKSKSTTTTKSDGTFGNSLIALSARGIF